MYTSKLLSTVPFIKHGFLTRQGGVSDGVFGSLNVGFTSGDAMDKIKANRQIVAEKISGNSKTPILSQRQIHSDIVNVVTTPWADDDRPEGDAMVTTQSGIILAALSADCMPILLVDETVPMVAAVHAGWGGAFKGVIQATIQKMLLIGAKISTIKAVIGPCIQPAFYEVGPEFFDRFLAKNKAYGTLFKPSSKNGHYLFDLSGYGEWCLRQTKIEQIENLRIDTYSNKTDFFSYRRSCHQGEKQYGSGISAIMINIS